MKISDEKQKILNNLFLSVPTLGILAGIAYKYRNDFDVWERYLWVGGLCVCFIFIIKTAYNLFRK